MLQDFNIDDCISLKAAARYLQISEKKLKTFVSMGLVRCFSFKGESQVKAINFFHKSELDRFVESMKKGCLGE